MEKREIFVVGCYPNTSEKIKILENTIEKLHSTNLPLLIVSHYPIPFEIHNKVNYIIYDQQNVISDWKLNYWILYPKFLKIVGKTEGLGYHAVACLSSIMNAVLFCRDKFDVMHFVESDIEFRIDDYLSRARECLYKFKNFFYAFEYEGGKNNLGIQHPLEGIWTGLMSFDIDWFYRKVPDIRTWSEYTKVANENFERVDYILEHWFYHLFKSRDMLKFSNIDNYESFEQIVLNKNLTDTGNSDTKLKIFLSELENKKDIILFFYNGTSETHTFRIEGEKLNTISQICLPNQIHYRVLPKTVGKIEVSMGSVVKSFNIQQDRLYLESKFRFYDDRLKCLEWSESDDMHFINSGEERD
jgi:hypothetical protein